MENSQSTAHHDLGQWRSKDIARFCCLAATRECSGVFNLGSGIGVSTNELVGALSDVLEICPTIKREPARQFDVPAIVLDSARAMQQFNWKSETNLRAGLVQVAEWLRELPVDEPNGLRRRDRRESYFAVTR